MNERQDRKVKPDLGESWATSSSSSFSSSSAASERRDPEERRPADPNSPHDLSLLAALGRLAREEATAGMALPADLVPVLSAAQREQIVGRILQLPLAGRGIAISRPDRLDAPNRNNRTFRKPVGRSYVMALAGLAAAAAALIIGVRLPMEERVSLPAYGVSAAGGLKEFRGTTAAAISPDEETTVATVQRLTADTELKVVCRPQSAFLGPIGVRTFLVKEGQAEEVRTKVRTAPTGAIELTARGGDLFALGLGHGQLRIVIASQGRLSAIDPTAAVEAIASADRRWLTVPLELDREPRSAAGEKNKTGASYRSNP